MRVSNIRDTIADELRTEEFWSSAIRQTNGVLSKYFAGNPEPTKIKGPMNITIRKGNPDDQQTLKQLFADTIKTVCIRDYTEEQIAVWAAGAENEQCWNVVLNTQFVLVAMNEHTITGFCTLENGYYLDFLYVHKDYQSQGIATALYQAIEEEALRQKQTMIHANVSETAKPFFEKMGFSTMQKQTIVVKDISLFNYEMIKSLN